MNELRNDMDDGHAACFPGTPMGVAVCHHLGKQPRTYKRRTHTQNMHLLELQRISRINNSKKSPSAHYQFSFFNSFLRSTYAGALRSSHPRFQNEAEQTNPLKAAGCHRHQQAVPLPARGFQRHGVAPPPRAPPRLLIPIPRRDRCGPSNGQNATPSLLQGVLFRKETTTRPRSQPLLLFLIFLRSQIPMLLTLNISHLK